MLRINWIQASLNKILKFKVWFGLGSEAWTQQIFGLPITAGLRKMCCNQLKVCSWTTLFQWLSRGSYVNVLNHSNIPHSCYVADRISKTVSMQLTHLFQILKKEVCCQSQDISSSPSRKTAVLQRRRSVSQQCGKDRVGYYLYFKL